MGVVKRHHSLDIHDMEAGTPLWTGIQLRRSEGSEAVHVISSPLYPARRSAA
jgi:hypothetical protein